jgi:hypothetical protein
VIAGDHHRHPPTRTDVLNTSRPSPATNTPAIVAGDRRTPSVSRANALRLNLMGAPPGQRFLFFRSLNRKRILLFTCSELEGVFRAEPFSV